VRALLRVEAAPGSARERELAREVTRELRGFLDVEELGKSALSDHWTTLDPARRARYTQLLRDLIERSYIQGLRANLEYQVAYGAERAEGDRLRVSTEVQARRRGRPHTIAIDYLLRPDGSSWRAIDVVTDGVGLVENYRSQFNRIIAREGVDGLLQRMEKRLAAE
jgi:phospholipid transport system substrate-binding protein